MFDCYNLRKQNTLKCKFKLDLSWNVPKICVLLSICNFKNRNVLTWYFYTSRFLLFWPDHRLFVLMVICHVYNSSHLTHLLDFLSFDGIVYLNDNLNILFDEPMFEQFFRPACPFPLFMPANKVWPKSPINKVTSLWLRRNWISRKYSMGNKCLARGSPFDPGAVLDQVAFHFIPTWSFLRRQNKINFQNISRRPDILIFLTLVLGASTAE